VLKVLQIFRQDNETRTDNVKEGIDFILSHFEGRQQLFPRKISTTYSNGKQFTVYNREQITNECVKANFIDCRINAYPVLGESYRQPPNIIFIDLDLSKELPYQEASKQLEKAKKKSLKIIKEKLNDCRPTILWTGNGYHIYIVLNTRPLELIKELKELSPRPSEEFLKFTEFAFSNKKKDSAHNPTFKSSLLRIPCTYNSKNQTIVKIIQEFDKENISSIDTELLRGFRLWLAENDIREKQQKLKDARYTKSSIGPKEYEIKNYFWIEKLLQTPIPCFRRYCLYRIVIPYLVNVKKLNDDECFNILKNWLEKCDRLSKISFDKEVEIKVLLNNVKNYLPLSIKKLNETWS
jgi:Primase X